RTSSGAAAAQSSPQKTSLGLIEASAINAGSFSGQNVDGTALLVRYTLMGDSDLSGTVDLTDFTFLASNFGATSGQGWIDGDYDYNGAVDLTDFTYLASDFNFTVPSGAVASLGTSIPEPASVAMVAVFMGIVSRRRTRGAA